MSYIKETKGPFYEMRLVHKWLDWLVLINVAEPFTHMLWQFFRNLHINNN